MAEFVILETEIMMSLLGVYFQPICSSVHELQVKKDL